MPTGSVKGSLTYQIRLLFIDGWTTEEISELLGCKYTYVRAVKSRLGFSGYLNREIDPVMRIRDANVKLPSKKTNEKFLKLLCEEARRGHYQEANPGVYHD